MRVYEIAKENGVSSKEVLSLLKKFGIELPSHMSLIPDNGLVYLKKAFDKTGGGLTDSKKTTVNKKREASTIKNTKIKNTKSTVKSRVGVGVSVKPAEKKDFSPLASRLSPAPKKVAKITIEQSLPLFQAARLMGKAEGVLILALLKKGMACNRNHVLSVDMISSLAQQFGFAVDIKQGSVRGGIASDLKKSETGSVRWPIVVVMGHVDHGKTTLLDYIRKMNVAAKEKGGITQHLGAYEVDSAHGKIVFLDTPGHEAFSYLRSRGASVTDIAVLIVAADDGVKPQTVEAIKHAKEAQVPIIVAVNKIDKVVGSAALQTVKRQLAEHDIVVEDWGGEVVCIPISAKTGQGVDELLEMIVLQAQMMDLKANADLPAKAFILESNLEKGHGPVATVICLEGTIKQGDYFICGRGAGKVRLLINSFGEKITQAGPSVPVKVVGFDKFAEIGDWLTVVPMQKYLKEKSSGSAARYSTPRLRDSQVEGERRINLIIKSDTRGSREAIEGSISRLSKLKKKHYPILNIVHSGIGGISEGDIELAETTGSYVFGLHVKAEKNAALLAKKKQLKINLFDIIYRMVEFLDDLLEKNKKVEKVWNKVGTAVVLKVFRIKKAGVIAGCGVKEGVFSRNNKVVCLRDDQKIGEGKIVSLQRESKAVKEVHAGYECGFVCDGFDGWKEGDVVECYVEVEETAS